jgi:hypothetical protein
LNSLFVYLETSSSIGVVKLKWDCIENIFID